MSGDGFERPLPRQRWSGHGGLNRRFFGVLSFAMIATGLTTGCAATASSQASEEAEFRNRVNAICAEAEAAFSANRPASGEVAGGHKFRRVLFENYRIGQQQLEEMADIEPPDHLAQNYDRLLADVAEALQALKHIATDQPESPQDEDIWGRVGRFSTEAEQMAERMGLNGCA